MVDVSNLQSVLEMGKVQAAARTLGLDAATSSALGGRGDPSPQGVVVIL
jgi:hypothetical protein